MFDEKQVLTGVYLEIRDHPFFAKDFSRSSQTNPKFALVIPSPSFFSISIVFSGDQLSIDLTTVALSKISPINARHLAPLQLALQLLKAPTHLEYFRKCQGMKALFR